MQQLQILNLSWNQIGDSGAIAIANSIINLTQLQNLYIGSNQIRDSGAIAIAHVASKLTRLQGLDISENNISEPVRQHIRQANKKHTFYI